MKFLTLTLIAFFSFSAMAANVCHYRFHDKLAVTIVFKGFGAGSAGSLSWDDVNQCGLEDGHHICTEMYAGSFKARFKDLTEGGTVGVTRFKIQHLSRKDDLGNKYLRKSQMGRFVRNARFSSVVIPEPNMTIHWKGKQYQMDCSGVAEE